MLAAHRENIERRMRSSVQGTRRHVSHDELNELTGPMFGLVWNARYLCAIAIYIDLI